SATPGDERLEVLLRFRGLAKQRVRQAATVLEEARVVASERDGAVASGHDHRGEPVQAANPTDRRVQSHVVAGRRRRDNLSELLASGWPMVERGTIRFDERTERTDRLIALLLAHEPAPF